MLLLVLFVQIYISRTFYTCTPNEAYIWYDHHQQQLRRNYSGSNAFYRYCVFNFSFFLFQTIFMFILCIITPNFLCGNFPSDIFLWHYLFWNLRLECLFNVWYLVATVITCWRSKTEIINHSAMNQSDHQQTTLYEWFFCLGCCLGFCFIFP